MKAALEEQVGMAESVVGNRVVLGRADGDMVVVGRSGQQRQVGTTDQVKIQLSIHCKSDLTLWALLFGRATIIPLLRSKKNILNLPVVAHRRSVGRG